MTKATKARSCGTYEEDKYLQKLCLKTEEGAISRELVVDRTMLKWILQERRTI
jgi:hypothetical protein